MIGASGKKPLLQRISIEMSYYWESPSGAEVDFITVTGDSITPYQVTWHEAKPRHERALDAFYEAFPQANEAVIIEQHNSCVVLS